MCREDGKRPDGITLVPWSRGKLMVWDVTCVDTLAQSHLHLTVENAGGAADDAERRKKEKYLFLGANYEFVPLGFETFGSWGAEAKDLVRQIGKKIAERSGERRSTDFLRQRISIEIQRGNSVSVFGTLPESRELEEVFYVVKAK